MIRHALESDAQQVADIYNYYVKNSVTTFEEAELSSAEFVERINKVRNQGYHWLVATVADKIVGYAYSSNWNERSAYKNTAEVSAYLRNGLTSKGWGTQLYQQLFSSLLEKNIHIVIGGITLPNPASVALHEKFGMKKVAHFNEVGYKFDQWLDVGYWQVVL